MSNGLANPALAERESFHEGAESRDPIISNSPQNFKLSNRRWAILFAVSLFGLTSSLTGDLSSLLHTMLDLLELPLNKYVYIQQVFDYVAAVNTFTTAWFIDRYGIRVSMYVATVLMLIRSMARALLFNPILPYWKRLKHVYWITSMITGNQVITVFFCLPLKISENWFATSERSVAWTVMMSSISIGASIAAFSFPRIVHQVQDVKPLFYLNIGSGIVTSLAILSCVTRSKPKDPPNERTAASRPLSINYFSSIKLIIKRRDIILHLMHESIFEGMLISTLTVIQDILTSVGHDEIFVGNLMSMNSLISVVSLISLATVVHRVKDTTLACKVASVMRAILFIVHLATMSYPLAGWIVIACAGIFSISRSWALPNLNNMTAHLASGAVPEATIAGVAITLFVLTSTTSQVAFVQLISVTKEGKSDYSYSIMFATIVCLVNTICYLVFFKGQKSDGDCAIDSNIEPSAA